MPKHSTRILCTHCNRKVSLRTERRHRTLLLAPTPPSTQACPKKARPSPQKALKRPTPTQEFAAGVSSQEALAYLRALLTKSRQQSFMTEESNENELDNDAWNPRGIDFDALPEKGGDPTVAWLDLHGLTAKEALGHDFAKMSANIRLKPLSTEDRLLVDAFNYRMYTNIPSNAAALLPFAFQDKRLADLPSLYQIQLRTAALSGIVPMLFDRCYNSCVSYTGELKNLSTCPYCSTPRYKPNGTPTAKPFSYLPIIPRLKAAMANVQMRKHMTYREQHQRSRKDGQYTDVFDGSHYQALLSQPVPGARKKDRRFFDDVRDIALALSTDGFCPFKKQKMTCWPILIYNLNLPPDIRFQLDNIICLGVIPGPKAVKDIETFLYPLIEELFELMHGVAAYDVEQDEMFVLCAFLILAFGDIPAISKLMSMKGHNGKVPCRACEIFAIRAPDSQSSAHYTPLHRSPSSVPPNSYDPLHLPLRSHVKMMAQACEVISARTNAEEKCLATQYGIKRIPLLSLIPSLDFPTSFPYDFMHLVWEGVVPNLLLLWTGEFKGLGEGTGSYQLAPTVFDAIGEAAAASGDHIPSSFGCRIPNPSKDRTYFTAESWSFWALHVGPIVLRRRFREEKYYTHFVKLVRILHLCLQFNITVDESQKIRVGLAEWVQTYEKLYYQYNPSRLPVCTLTIHGLLHIADSIAALGPPWVYWAFPTERFCGSLLPAVRSRRHPFSNIDRHVYDVAILSQLKLLYGLELDLSKRRQKALSGSVDKPVISKYYTFELMCPKADLPVVGDIRRKTLAALATRYGCDWSHFREVVPASLPQWGKVRKSNAGDLMTARGAIRLYSGARDNSFVRYKLNVDIMAHRPRASPVFSPRIFYGQLRHVFQVQIPCLDNLGIQAETIVFALIQQCNLVAENNFLDIPYYKQIGTTEVVDLRVVQCAVGRVPDRGIWGIVDRRGVLGSGDYVGDEDYSDDDEPEIE